MRVYIDVFTPMPRARVTRATIVKAGALRSVRMARGNPCHGSGLIPRMAGGVSRTHGSSPGFPIRLMRSPRRSRAHRRRGTRSRSWQVDVDSESHARRSGRNGPDVIEGDVDEAGWTGGSPRRECRFHGGRVLRPGVLRLQGGDDQRLGSRVPPRRQRREGADPAQGARRHQGPLELLERTEGRHGEAGGRLLDRHDPAARPRPPLLHADRRRRGDERPGQPRLLRRQQACQRGRGSRSRRRLLRDQGRAARPGARGLVRLEGHRHLAPCARLSPAGLRPTDEDALPGALPAARRRRGRDRLDPPGPRELHPRQPDRRGKLQADDRRDGLRLRAPRRPARCPTSPGSRSARRR